MGAGIIVSMADEDGYLLANARAEAGTRFEALSAIFDPPTFRRIDALGIAAGWRCWEVGAGGASVPRGLADRVGPTGRVLATDIDVRWARAAASEVVEVRRHDVARDDPPDEGFDLVHARLVLVHVADRERALRSMVAALRPGGRILLEDADPALQPLASPYEHGPRERLANRIRTGFRAMLAERGADLAYGRRLPASLRAAGLTGVAAEAHFPIASPACDLLETATVAHIRDGLVAGGHATEEEIERHLANVAAGGMDLATAPMVAAWGRRPE
ncbi:methyltransferase [Actinoallomurus iriomotensis]|uniref:Methyltransferase n=2 Tax=Thermomonosporaceae TaxID=2012 RepID=A0A9W6RI28_9ACTN|nr:methyltransferase [Actinoallomurus iriomotensis]